MTIKTNPVAVFDSGVGGISVLKELVRLLPGEDFIYFGDSANAPYGTKTIEEVRELTCKHITRMIDDGAKAVVIACNTATSAAAETLRDMFPNTPIIGIEPALKPAVFSAEHPSVLVMATPMTLRLDKFNRLFSKYHEEGDIHLLPCNGLADLIETGDINSDKTKAFLAELLKDYVEKPIDAVVLGCTHYPFVRRIISEILGKDVQIIDGSIGTANELKRRLAELDLLNTETKNGKVIFENSLGTKESIDLCKTLFAAKY